MTLKIRTQTRRFMFNLFHAFVDGGMGTMGVSALAPNEINTHHVLRMVAVASVLGAIRMWQFLDSVKYEDLFTDTGV